MAGAGDIGRGVRTYLQTVSAITDVTSTRMYPDVLPQNATLPAIVFSVVSGLSVTHFTGSAELSQTRLQIDCIATTRITANSLGELVRKNLEHYTGAGGSEYIKVALAESPRYDYDPPRDASDQGRYTHSRDYMIWHEEASVST